MKTKKEIEARIKNLKKWLKAKYDVRYSHSDIINNIIDELYWVLSDTKKEKRK